MRSQRFKAFDQNFLCFACHDLTDAVSTPYETSISTLCPLRTVNQVRRNAVLLFDH